MKRKLLSVMSIVIVMLLVVTPILAQSEVPPTTSPEEGTLTAALELIIKAIANATFIPVAAGLVVALTGIAKHFIPTTVPAGAIALTFQVILWVAWVAALHFGYGSQFESLIQTFTTIAVAVAGLIGSTIVATRTHNAAAANNVPLAGFKRTET